MKNPEDVARNLENVRKAYADLSSKLKAQISLGLWESNPVLFTEWSKIAETKYHHHKAAASRPPGVGAKLDAALLKGRASEWLLANVFAAYFCSNHEDWVKFVRQRVGSETARSVESRLQEALNDPQRPFAGDPLERLFVAASQLKPEDWIERKAKGPPKDTADFIEKPCHADGDSDLSKPAVNLQETPKQTSLYALYEDLNTRAREVEEALARGKEAHDFNLRSATAALDQIAVIGGRLREQIKDAAEAVSEATPEWQTLTEHRQKLEALEQLRKQHEAFDHMRARLESIRVGLVRLEDVGSKTARKRAAVESARTKAIIEIAERLRRKDEGLLDIPGSESGEEWIRQSVDLAPPGLDAHLTKLRSLGLEALAGFIEEVESSARIQFLREAVQSPVAETGSGNTDNRVSPTSINPEEIDSLPVRCDGGGHFDVGPERLPVPPVDGGQDTGREVAQKVENLAKVEDAESAAFAAGKITNRDAGHAMYLSAEPSAPNGSSASGSENHTEVIEAVERLALSGRWHLASLLSGTIDDTGFAPPSAIFRIIAAQAHLASPNGELAQEIGKDLAVVAARTLTDQPANHLFSWSACILPALLAPTQGAAALLRAVELPSDLAPLSEIAAAVVKLVDHVRGCNAELIRGGKEQAIWERESSDLRAAVRQFATDALNQTILYQPATEVWKHLLKSGIMGTLVQELQRDPVATRAQHVRSMLRDIRESKSLHRIINETNQVIARVARVHRIEARALPQFEGKLRPLIDLGDMWIRLAENRPPSTDFIGENISHFQRAVVPLLPTAEAARQSWMGASHGPFCSAAAYAAERAIARLGLLLDLGSEWRNSDGDWVEERLLEILCVQRCDTDEQGILEHEPSEMRSILIEAARQCALEVNEAARLRIRRGDLRGASLILHTARKLQCAGAEDLGKWLPIEEDRLRRELGNAVAALERKLMGGRALGVFADSQSIEIGERMAKFRREASGGLNLASLRSEMQVLDGELDRLRQLKIQETQAEILSQVTDERLQRRLLGLATKGNVSTVHEYIGRLRQNHPLPEHSEPSGELFGGFSPERQKHLFDRLRDSGGIAGIATEIQSGGEFCGSTFSESTVDQREYLVRWLESWQVLKLKKQANSDALTTLFTGLGFVVKQTEVRTASGESVADVLVETLSDRSLCVIPRFGSQTHGRITARFIWNQSNEQQVVQSIGETSRDTALHFAIYLAPLSADRRNTIARICREKHRSFLLLDEVLMAHLATELEDRLAKFFRAATPYTFADPFVLGSTYVPPEMFFGRNRELHALIDSGDGRCFVYGGRQLGKTALLREAERRFSNPESHRYSAWIDLINHGIGSERPPAHLWTIVASEALKWPAFRQFIDGFGRKSADTADRLEAWLGHDPRVRILLLLDEADKFLQEDAKLEFSVARQLKGLMDRTSRRFKVVFAGLHNVQRTTLQANHPLAHLGEAINVGAFSQSHEWGEAFGLVREPMNALGVYFESNDLITRVLSLANFYPGIVQQFCSKLWRRFLDRRVQGPPFEVADTHIDEIYGDQHLRQEIVGRFNLTLQLDPRYWILAYVFALEFCTRGKALRDGMAVAELRSSAESWFSVGFAQLSEDEFRTLLDEMCGLGVFHEHSSGRFGFRNPNLLMLLGSEREIEDRLLRGPRTVVEFTPKTFRARLSRRTVGPPHRRVFSLSEESRLSDASHGVALVIGSDALALPLLEASLGDVFPKNRNHTVPRSIKTAAQFDQHLEGIKEATRNQEDGVHLLFVRSTSPWDLDWIQIAAKYCERLQSKRRFIRIVLECDADRAWRCQFAAPSFALTATRIVLRKWQEDFVQPWLTDLGLASDDEIRLALLDAFQGWPHLLASFAEAYAQEADWRKAMEFVVPRNPTDDEKSRFKALFVGTSGEATDALELMRNVRRQQPNASDPIRVEDYQEIASLFGKPLGFVESTICTASTLGLLNVSSQQGLAWDPVYDRLVLSC